MDTRAARIARLSDQLFTAARDGRAIQPIEAQGMAARLAHLAAEVALLERGQPQVARLLPENVISLANARAAREARHA